MLNINSRNSKLGLVRITILRWLVTLLVLGSLCLTGFSCARDETENQKASSGEVSASRKHQSGQIEWLDFNDGLAKARSENKPLFVEFYTDWCIYCRKFQKETIKDRNVGKMLSENFAYVRVNAENSKNRVKFYGKSLSNVELTQVLGITAFPALVFLDSEGKPISKLFGFIPPRQFTAVLDYIHQKCYETQISFDEFAKKGNCN